MFRLLIILILALPMCLYGQNACVDTSFITGSTQYCIGDTAFLSFPGANVNWSANRLIGPNGTNTAMYDVNGVLQVIATSIDTLNVNLIQNPNFTNGIAGYTTDFTNYIPPPGSIMFEGFYSVVTDAHVLHPGFYGNDHTTGSSTFLVFNGDSSYLLPNILCQEVIVQPNTTYLFSFWLSNVLGRDPAQLYVAFNNVPDNNIYTLNAPAGVWYQQFATWYSGNDTIVEICLRNYNYAYVGNDFGIDDWNFRPICLSADTMTLTTACCAVPIPNTIIDTSVCSSIGYFVSGAWQYSSGTYTDTFASINACDSVVITNLIVSASDSSFEYFATCNPLNAGTTTLNYTNQYGCDSVHRIITTLLPSDTINEYLSSCNPADVGVVTMGYLNQYNCDSVHNVITTMRPPDSTYTYLGSCDIADTGRVVVSYTNQFGCDSVHSVVTTLLRSDSTFAYLSSCDSIDIGVVSVNLVNQYGCDSVHTITTVFILSTTETQAITVCEGDSVEVGNSIYVQEGTYIDTLTSEAGCDSIVYTSILVLPTIIDTFFDTVFIGDLYNGLPVNSSTVFTDNNISADGCDSLSVVILTALNRPQIYFPLAFSPNGDGMNDYFRPLGDCITGYRIMIFNRWGQKVFESNSVNIAWDGTYKNEPVDMGVFVFVAEASICNGKNQIYKGNISLLR